MTKLLNLQHLIIYSIKEKDNQFEIKCGRPEKPKCCPYCKSKNFIKHGKGRLRKIRHGITINGEMLFINWQNLRFKCKDCEKTWTKKPPKWLVNGKERSTITCQKQALRILKNTNFKETERQTGLKYNVLRKVLVKNITFTSLLKIPSSGDLTIGIDEHSRRKRTFATTLTLIKPERKLLAILPVKSNKNLHEWILKNWTNEERYRVKEVCLDMAKCWFNVIPSLFPNAKMVIDHFHVIQYLNQLISKEYRFLKSISSKKVNNLLPYRTKGLGIIRKLYQSEKYWTEMDKERIQKVFQIFPKVKYLWELKEEVRKIYWECKKDKPQARKRWNIVLSKLDKVPQETLRFHLENILNYFNNYSTNAFTEGIHTKFKLIKRYSFGITNPEIYVKKLMLGFVKPKTLIYNHSF